MNLPDRLDEIAGKLLATKDYSTFSHAIYQAAIELRAVLAEAPQPPAELLERAIRILRTARCDETADALSKYVDGSQAK